MCPNDQSAQDIPIGGRGAPGILYTFLPLQGGIPSYSTLSLEVGTALGDQLLRSQRQAQSQCIDCQDWVRVGQDMRIYANIAISIIRQLSLVGCVALVGYSSQN